MNLRNNYLLKKLLKWVNKKYKKIKKNNWRYHRFTFIYQKPKWYNLQFLRYKCDRLKMVIMDHFCPFTHPPPPPPLKTRKTRISKKWKKLLEISSFYTRIPKTTIIWCAVPEIWREMTEFLQEGGGSKILAKKGVVSKKGNHFERRGINTKKLNFWNNKCLKH